MTSTDKHDNGALPLSGICVIEFGVFHAGPTCAAMLGALGAEVIKIEELKKGDPARKLRHLFGQDCTLPGGRSVPFETYNSGKKSVAINLAYAEARRAFYALVAKADVFIHNVRAETAVALQIDYETLLRYNPRLVYASVSGFGPSGPEARRPGLDPVGLARSGLMSVLSGGSHQQPFLPPMGMADHMAGIMVSYGVLAGLLARDRTGTPQRIESSLLGSAMWLGQLNLQYALFFGKELRPLDHASEPLINSYQCQDGRWMFIAALSERAWPALCAGLDLEKLATDPRFCDSEVRWTNRVVLTTLLKERFASRAAADWALDFAKQPELVFEVVHRPTDIGTDPQVLANGYVAETDHPELGRAKRVALPLHLNGALAGGVAAAPRHGQHTEEILMSVAGLSREELAALQEQGAI